MNKRMRGYKYRAYPTKTQSAIIDKIFGCSRYVYNYYLDWRTRQWREFRNPTNYVATSRHLSHSLKPAQPWLCDADAVALQQSLRDLDVAFARFFSKRGRYPSFKRKRGHQSYRTMCQNDCVRINGNRVRLPKVGWVKFANSRDFCGEIKFATVSKTASGKYFISLQVEEPFEVLSNSGGVIGIDVGISHFYTDSNSNVVDSPKALYQHQRKLKRLHRRLTRKQRGSANYRKASLRFAGEHERVANIRNDFLHKQSFALANENQIVCVESLNVGGMLKNHHLAKATSDASWSRFFSLLEYKVASHGGELVKVPTFFPSSQLCSCCGYQNRKTRNLSIRQWTCPQCGARHNRDANAAKNILNQGLSLIA